MIITLTPNPAVDQTVWLERLHLAVRNRYQRAELDPAGKGVNVSRMARRLGEPTIALGFLAGETGLLVERALDDEGVPHRFVRVPGQTRINVVVAEEASGDESALQGPGPRVGPGPMAELERVLDAQLAAGHVLVLAGSLPPGAPQDAYAGLIRRAKGAGVRTILNTRGEPLRLGVRAGPDVVKANADELEELLGRPLRDVGAVARGARQLVGQGVGAVAVGMGLQGTVCVQGGRAWWASFPPGPHLSQIGAGDSLVAGLAVALARGDDIVNALRLGSAAGAATMVRPGTRLGSAAQVMALRPQVRIEEITELAFAAPRPALPPRLPWPASLLLAAGPPLRVGALGPHLLRLLGWRVTIGEPEPHKRPVLPRERLRYGMDIDGTVTQAPRHFKRLIDALLEAGDTVYIVTARLERDREETEGLLAGLGIRYDELIMRPDDWPRSIADFKVHAVREREIHLLMDDDPRNCWAVLQRTKALAGHMLPIPETVED